MARRKRRKGEEIVEEVVETVETPKEQPIEFDNTVTISELEPFDEYTADYDTLPEEVVEESPVFEDVNLPPVVNEEPEPIIEDPKEEPKKEPKKAKKDLNKFFEQDKKKTEKLKKKQDKPTKVKKKSKRQLQKEKDYEAIKDKRVFKYKGKKYNKVEDFIKYLNDHYLDLEQIALEVLEDENFLGWISKKSGNFSESIKKFKEIKQEIENN